MGSGTTTRLRGERAIDEAIAAIRAGEIVALPMETVYALCASAASPDSLARLAEMTGVEPGGEPVIRSTWHAAGIGEIEHLLRHTNHRGLVRRLAPGPVRFLIETEDPASAARAIGALPGVIERDGAIAARVQAHPLTASVLASAGFPVVAEGVAAAGLGDGRELPDDLPGVAVAMDAGATEHGKPSTTVRLGLGGGVAVEREGVYEERYVLKQNKTSILFVCTGNTCRSPMAEAIARHLAENTNVEIGSAGVMAGAGMPASPEVDEALRSIGVAAHEHRSRPITRDMIADADLILTMTRSHAEDVLRLDPSAAGRVRPLDEGGDIPDPIGGPQEVYNSTAAHLRELIARRLKELDA